jgi:hypothetical protein
VSPRELGAALCSAHAARLRQEAQRALDAAYAHEARRAEAEDPGEASDALDDALGAYCEYQRCLGEARKFSGRAAQIGGVT